MFDYAFENEDEIYEEISNMKDENIKKFIAKITYESTLKAAAEEYEKIHGKEVVGLYDKFCEEHKAIKDYMEKIAFLLDDNIVGYVLDIVYDIVGEVEKEMYDLGYYDGEWGRDGGFVEFIREEVPEIYEQLKENYKKKASNK